MSDRVIAIVAVLVLIALLVGAAIWSKGSVDDQAAVETSQRVPTLWYVADRALAQED